MQRGPGRAATDGRTGSFFRQGSPSDDGRSSVSRTTDPTSVNLSDFSGVTPVLTVSQPSPHPFPPQRQQEQGHGQDLLQSLLLAESRLLAREAEPSESDPAEDRDNVQLGQQAEEEIRSSSSSSRSSGGSGALRTRRTRPKSAAQSSSQAALPAPSTGSRSTSSSDVAHAENAHSASNSSLVIQDLMEQAVRKGKAHDVEIIAMEEKLQAAVEREGAALGEAAIANELVASLEATGVENLAANTELKGLLAEAIAKGEQGDLDLNDANDRIAGLVARHAQKVLNMREDQLRLEIAQGKEHDAKVAGMAADEVLAQARNAELLAELVQARAAKKGAADERDRLRDFVKDMKKQQQGTLANIQEMILGATAALGLGGDEAKEAVGGLLGLSSAPRLEPTLLQQLETSQGQKREVTEALTKLRLEMLSLEGGNITRDGEMQVMLDEGEEVEARDCEGPGSSSSSSARAGSPSLSADPSQNSAGGLGAGGRGRGRGMAVAGRGVGLGGRGGGYVLSAIPEVDNEDATSLASSMTSAHRVNCADKGDVGDLGDFDDAASVGRARESHEDEAMGVAERARFRSMLAMLEQEVAQGRQDRFDAKEEAADDRAQNRNNIERLQRLLKTSQSDHDDSLEELKHLKQQALANDKRHETLMEAMRVSLNEAQAALAKQARNNMEEREEQDVANEAMRAELVCALEGKRLADSRVLELQLALAATEKEHELTIGRLRKEFGQQRLEAGLGPGTSLQELVEKLTEERNILLNDLEVKDVQAQSVVEELQRDQATEMEFLRRQHRREADDIRAQLGDEIAALKDEVAGLRDFCSQAQDACWRALSTSSQAPALRCRPDEDFRLRAASGAAASLWGDEAVREGASLVGLEKEAWERCDLQQAVRTACALAVTTTRPRCSFLDLGRAPFDFGGGGARGASVVAVLFALPRTGGAWEADLQLSLRPDPS